MDYLQKQDHPTKIGTDGRMDQVFYTGAREQINIMKTIAYRRVVTLFLDASSHLYKRVCLSVSPSVRRSPAFWAVALKGSVTYDSTQGNFPRFICA